jgi:hypothetical protein
MRLYSYPVKFDGGFAPYVSESLCTSVITSKPAMREQVKTGQWEAVRN